jgi:hypothetical protein
MRRCVWVLFVLAGLSLRAEEPRPPTPAPVPGAGEAADGLRASASVVKADFGPGESIMLVFKLTNESKTAASVKLGRNHVFDFSFETKRDGKDVPTARVDFNDYFSPQVTLEPGETTSRAIDLRAIHTVDPKWADQKGKYEVRLNYIHKGLKTGWVAFGVAGIADRPPDPNEKLNEQIRGLIAQLGNDEFAVRERAYADLLTIGQPALRLLQDTVDTGADVEIATRCKKLIDEIRKKTAPVKPRPVPPPPPPPPEPPPEEF